MTTSDVLTGARTMWELVDRRAQLSPDHPLLIAADGETVTSGQFRDRVERVAAGLLRHGDQDRIGRLLAAADPDRHRRALHRPGPPRRGPEPDHPPLPRAGGGLRAAPDRCRALRHPGHVAQHRLPSPSPRGPWRAPTPGPPSSRPTTACPRATRPCCRRRRKGRRPRTPRSAGSTTRPDRPPTPRACSTPTRRSSPAAGVSPVPSTWVPTTSARSPSRSPTSPAPTIWSPCCPWGSRPSSSRPSRLPTCSRSSAGTAPPWSGGAPPSTWPTSASNARHPDEPILPSLRLMSGGGAAKPPEVHYEVRDEIGGRGVVHGYGMTEVPMIANGSPHDTDEQLANTDGKPVEGADVRIVTLDGRLAGSGRGGRGAGEGPDGLPRLHRPRPRTPRPSTRTATSAPATWAGCGPTGT